MMPTECKMPDLSDCSAERLLGWSLVHAFDGDPGINRKEGSYRRNFVRLIDKAVYEYQMARNAILADIAEAARPYEVMVETGRLIFIFDYCDHMENCINSINRALHLFERMKSETILCGVSRELRRSLEACSRSLPDVRDAFEHVDERIQKDQIADGQPVMLSIGGDGDRAVIGTDEVLFTDVARMLRKLHEIGKLLFDNERVRASSVALLATGGGIALAERTGDG